MMKTEVSTNGEAAVLEARDRGHPAATPDYERNGSARFDDALDRSGEEKKPSLFRRPGVIVVGSTLSQYYLLIIAFVILGLALVVVVFW
jgi:hypothetical protein